MEQQDHFDAWRGLPATATPYRVFIDPEIFEREQERIYRGPTWHFIAFEDEIKTPGDYKSTFIGTTPVVVDRKSVV